MFILKILLKEERNAENELSNSQAISSPRLSDYISSTHTVYYFCPLGHYQIKVKYYTSLNLLIIETITPVRKPKIVRQAS